MATYTRTQNSNGDALTVRLLETTEIHVSVLHATPESLKGDNRYEFFGAIAYYQLCQTISSRQQVTPDPFPSLPRCHPLS